MISWIAIIKIIDTLLKESSPFCFCRAWSWTSGVENTWKKELLVALFYISHGLHLSSSLNHKRGLQITPWIRLIDIAFNILHEHYGPRIWASIRPINKVQAGSHLVGSKTWPPKLTYFDLTLSPVELDSSRSPQNRRSHSLENIIF